MLDFSVNFTENHIGTPKQGMDDRVATVIFRDFWTNWMPFTELVVWYGMVWYHDKYECPMVDDHYHNYPIMI